MGRQLCNHNRKTEQSGPKLGIGRIRCQSLHIPVFARGLMAGRIKSSQEAQAAEILDPFCVKRLCFAMIIFKRLARCEELAEKKGCTVSQIALVWMFQQGLNMYVLVSTTKAFRLEENLRAFTVELSEDEIRYLNLQEE